MPDYLSAYRCNYSTEHCLLRITNDILYSMDKQCLTPVIAVDLSAASDTVGHEILIKVLQRIYRISRTALEWFRNYLNDRYVKVQIGSEFLGALQLCLSVPQGSDARESV